MQNRAAEHLYPSESLAELSGSHNRIGPLNTHLWHNFQDQGYRGNDAVLGCVKSGLEHVVHAIFQDPPGLGSRCEPFPAPSWQLQGRWLSQWQPSLRFP